MSNLLYFIYGQCHAIDHYLPTALTSPMQTEMVLKNHSLLSRILSHKFVYIAKVARLIGGSFI